MSVDDAKKIDQAREDRVRQIQKEDIRPRPKETEFDRALERSQQSGKLLPQQQSQSKVATEDAIREATRHDDGKKDDGKRDEDERKEKKDSRDGGEKRDVKTTGEKVIAKGKLKQDSSGTGGGKEGGSSSFTSRREITKTLTKLSAKCLPVDLEGKFAKRLAETMKGASAADQAILTQKILNRIIQYVRIGINKKGEKEIQLELHERIFRGLKLRVVAREGKVGVFLRTANAKGRDALEKNKEALLKALSDKGIDVDELEIS